jgi:hypothetical protein
MRRRLADAVVIAVAASAFACAANAANIPAAAARDVELRNPGFEAGLNGAGHPHGWVPMHHVSTDAYVFALDEVRRSGAKSMRITHVGPEPYGALVQRVQDPALRGKTVRFSGWLRTRDSKGAVLIVQAMRSGVPVAFDHMRGSAVKGTTDWTRYAITLAVPDAVQDLEVGAMLLAGGTLWFDDAKLEIVAP